MPGKSADESLTLCAVGDVLPNRAEPEKLFDLCFDAFRACDLRVCQLETNFTERGSLSSAARSGMRAHPRNVAALKAGGFDVVSFASNHTLDWGLEGMVDTIDTVRNNGMGLIGAGTNIVEARRPAILERKGTKVAFLAYNSIVATGYAADQVKPGVAPLRIKTLYEMFEYDQPGCPARIFTYPNEADMEAMLDDIRKAKSAADVVVLYLHWGLHHVRSKLAGYQQGVARAALDAGADIIIGTHPHILKAVEVYKGKVIFYSVGNFALDSSLRSWPNLSKGLRELVVEYKWDIDPAWARTYPYPVDSRKTIAVKCLISDKKIQRVSFLPATINIDARPQILSHDDEKFGELVQYMKDVTAEVGMNGTFKVEGDEVVVSA